LYLERKEGFTPEIMEEEKLGFDRRPLPTIRRKDSKVMHTTFFKLQLERMQTYFRV